MTVPQRITETYADTLEVIDFVVSRTSDSLAEILTKALPLVAPIPNAVSIYYVSQTALSYNNIQALAVAASIECMFFALTEVVLKSWELWHTDKQYKFPLIVSVSAFVTYFILVMALVYMLEVSAGHSIAPLAFPVVSVVAAVALGVTRWHKRNAANMTVPATKAKTVTVPKTEKVSQPVSQPASAALPVIQQTDTNSQMLTDKEKMSVSERRNRIAELLQSVNDVTDTIVSAWATQFSVSDRTIWRDIQTVSSPNSD